MAHKSKVHVSTQIYGILSALVVVLGIVVNWYIRPDIFGASIAYSVYGTLPETKYIFSGSLIIAAMLLILESHYIGHRLRRLSCYSIALGFVVIALVPINNGYKTDMIHGLGVLLTLIGLLSNLFLGIKLRRPFLGNAKFATYVFLLILALVAAAISILSSGRFGVLELQGFAEYAGLAVYTGWVLLDFGDTFTSTAKSP